MEPLPAKVALDHPVLIWYAFNTNNATKPNTDTTTAAIVHGFAA